MRGDERWVRHKTIKYSSTGGRSSTMENGSGTTRSRSESTSRRSARPHAHRIVVSYRISASDREILDFLETIRRLRHARSGTESDSVKLLRRLRSPTYFSSLNPGKVTTRELKLGGGQLKTSWTGMKVGPPFSDSLGVVFRDLARIVDHVGKRDFPSEAHVKDISPAFHSEQLVRELREASTPGTVVFQRATASLPRGKIITSQSWAIEPEDRALLLTRPIPG